MFGDDADLFGGNKDYVRAQRFAERSGVPLAEIEQEVAEILRDHVDVVERVAREVERRETLSEDDIYTLLDGDFIRDASWWDYSPD